MGESGFESENSSKGFRAKDDFNWQLKNCSNVIGVLVEKRLLNIDIFNCSVNAEAFECWVE